MNWRRFASREDPPRQTLIALHARKESFEIASQIAHPPMERPIPAAKPWAEWIPSLKDRSIQYYIVYIAPNLRSDIIAILVAILLAAGLFAGLYSFSRAP